MAVSKRDLKEIFVALGEEAFSLSHYQLADRTGHPPEDWKRFITDPETAEWVKSEVNLLQQAKIKQLVSDLGGKNKSSMGLGAQINALSKQLETQNGREGETFVYTYVPLDDEQKKAQNVRKESKDIFRKINPITGHPLD